MSAFGAIFCRASLDRRRFVYLLRGDELRKDEEKTKRKMERQKKAARSSAGGACVSRLGIFFGESFVEAAGFLFSQGCGGEKATRQIGQKDCPLDVRPWWRFRRNEPWFSQTNCVEDFRSPMLSTGVIARR